MQIQNPTPIEAGTFNKMWVNHLRITFSGTAPALHASLLPYDGQHTIASEVKRVFIPKLVEKRSQDAQLDVSLTALVAEAKRQSKISNKEIVSVTVMAPSPSRPVIAVIELEGQEQKYIIPNCFELAGEDEVFAGVLNETLAEIARQAGLPVA